MRVDGEGVRLRPADDRVGAGVAVPVAAVDVDDEPPVLVDGDGAVRGQVVERGRAVVRGEVDVRDRPVEEAVEVVGASVARPGLAGADDDGLVVPREAAGIAVRVQKPAIQEQLHSIRAEVETEIVVLMRRDGAPMGCDVMRLAIGLQTNHETTVLDVGHHMAAAVEPEAVAREQRPDAVRPVGVERQAERAALEIVRIARRDVAVIAATVEFQGLTGIVHPAVGHAGSSFPCVPRGRPLLRTRGEYLTARRRLRTRTGWTVRRADAPGGIRDGLIRQ